MIQVDSVNPSDSVPYEKEIQHDAFKRRLGKCRCRTCAVDIGNDDITSPLTLDERDQDISSATRSRSASIDSGCTVSSDSSAATKTKISVNVDVHKIRDNPMYRTRDCEIDLVDDHSNIIKAIPTENLTQEIVGRPVNCNAVGVNTQSRGVLLRKNPVPRETVHNTNAVRTLLMQPPMNKKQTNNPNVVNDSTQSFEVYRSVHTAAPQNKTTMLLNDNYTSSNVPSRLDASAQCMDNNQFTNVNVNIYRVPCPSVLSRSAPYAYQHNGMTLPKGTHQRPSCTVRNDAPNHYMTLRDDYYHNDPPPQIIQGDSPYARGPSTKVIQNKNMGYNFPGQYCTQQFQSPANNVIAATVCYTTPPSYGTVTHGGPMQYPAQFPVATAQTPITNARQCFSAVCPSANNGVRLGTQTVRLPYPGDRFTAPSFSNGLVRLVQQQSNYLPFNQSNSQDQPLDLRKPKGAHTNGKDQTQTNNNMANGAYIHSSQPGHLNQQRPSLHRNTATRACLSSYQQQNIVAAKPRLLAPKPIADDDVEFVEQANGYIVVKPVEKPKEKTKLSTRKNLSGKKFVAELEAQIMREQGIIHCDPTVSTMPCQGDMSLPFYMHTTSSQRVVSNNCLDTATSSLPVNTTFNHSHTQSLVNPGSSVNGNTQKLSPANVTCPTVLPCGPLSSTSQMTNDVHSTTAMHCAKQGTLIPQVVQAYDSTCSEEDEEIPPLVAVPTSSEVVESTINHPIMQKKLSTVQLNEESLSANNAFLPLTPPLEEHENDMTHIPQTSTTKFLIPPTCSAQTLPATSRNSNTGDLHPNTICQLLSYRPSQTNTMCKSTESTSIISIASAHDLQKVDSHSESTEESQMSHHVMPNSGSATTSASAKKQRKQDLCTSASEDNTCHSHRLSPTDSVKEVNNVITSKRCDDHQEVIAINEGVEDTPLIVNESKKEKLNSCLSKKNSFPKIRLRRITKKNKGNKRDTLQQAMRSLSRLDKVADYDDNQDKETIGYNEDAMSTKVMEELDRCCELTGINIKKDTAMTDNDEFEDVEISDVCSLKSKPRDVLEEKTVVATKPCTIEVATHFGSSSNGSPLNHIKDPDEDTRKVNDQLDPRFLSLSNAAFDDQTHQVIEDAFDHLKELGNESEETVSYNEESCCSEVNSNVANKSSPMNESQDFPQTTEAIDLTNDEEIKISVIPAEVAEDAPIVIADDDVLLRSNIDTEKMANNSFDPYKSDLIASNVTDGIQSVGGPPQTNIENQKEKLSTQDVKQPNSTSNSSEESRQLMTSGMSEAITPNHAIDSLTSPSKDDATNQLDPEMPKIVWFGSLSNQSFNSNQEVYRKMYEHNANMDLDAGANCVVTNGVVVNLREIVDDSDSVLLNLSSNRNKRATSSNNSSFDKGLEMPILEKIVLSDTERPTAQDTESPELEPIFIEDNPPLASSEIFAIVCLNNAENDSVCQDTQPSRTVYGVSGENLDTEEKNRPLINVDDSRSDVNLDTEEEGQPLRTVSDPGSVLDLQTKENDHQRKPVYESGSGIDLQTKEKSQILKTVNGPGGDVQLQTEEKGPILRTFNDLGINLDLGTKERENELTSNYIGSRIRQQVEGLSSQNTKPDLKKLPRKKQDNNLKFPIVRLKTCYHSHDESFGSNDYKHTPPKTLNTKYFERNIWDDMILPPAESAEDNQTRFLSKRALRKALDTKVGLDEYFVEVDANNDENTSKRLPGKSTGQRTSNKRYKGYKYMAIVLRRTECHGEEPPITEKSKKNKTDGRTTKRHRLDKNKNRRQNDTTPKRPITKRKYSPKNLKTFSTTTTFRKHKRAYKKKYIKSCAEQVKLRHRQTSNGPVVQSSVVEPGTSVAKDKITSLSEQTSSADFDSKGKVHPAAQKASTPSVWSVVSAFTSDELNEMCSISDKHPVTNKLTLRKRKRPNQEPTVSTPKKKRGESTVSRNNKLVVCNISPREKTYTNVSSNITTPITVGSLTGKYQTVRQITSCKTKHRSSSIEMRNQVGKTSHFPDVVKNCDRLNESYTKDRIPTRCNKSVLKQNNIKDKSKCSDTNNVVKNIEKTDAVSVRRKRSCEMSASHKSKITKPEEESKSTRCKNGLRPNDKHRLTGPKCENRADSAAKVKVSTSAQRDCTGRNRKEGFSKTGEGKKCDQRTCVKLRIVDVSKQLNARIPKEKNATNDDSQHSIKNIRKRYIEKKRAIVNRLMTGRRAKLHNDHLRDRKVDRIAATDTKLHNEHLRERTVDRIAATDTKLHNEHLRERKVDRIAATDTKPITKKSANDSNGRRRRTEAICEQYYVVRGEGKHVKAVKACNYSETRDGIIVKAFETKPFSPGNDVTLACVKHRQNDFTMASLLMKRLQGDTRDIKRALDITKKAGVHFKQMSEMDEIVFKCVYKDIDKEMINLTDLSKQFSVSQLEDLIHWEAWKRTTKITKPFVTRNKTKHFLNLRQIHEQLFKNNLFGSLERALRMYSFRIYCASEHEKEHLLKKTDYPGEGVCKIVCINDLAGKLEMVKKYLAS